MKHRAQKKQTTQKPTNVCQWARCDAKATWRCSWWNLELEQTDLLYCNRHKVMFIAGCAENRGVDRYESIQLSQLPDVALRIPEENKFQDMHTESISTCLVEFVCNGCLHSIYKPMMLVQADKEIGSYPSIDEIEAKLAPDKEMLRHVRPVFADEKREQDNLAGGFAFCGYYTVVRLWKEWENNARFTVEDDNGKSASVENGAADNKAQVEGN